jgi:hypothetical protein
VNPADKIAGALHPERPTQNKNRPDPLEPGDPVTAYEKD